jgi:hypothetical protein
MHLSLLLLFITFCPLLTVAQRSDKACQRQLEYLFDYPSKLPKISLHSIEGRAVTALGGEPISSLCVLLLTENGHKVVAQTITGKNGNFRFGKLPKGEYRLLARVQNLDGACAINLRVELKSYARTRSFRRKRLRLNMGVAGLNDVECSNAEAK